MTHGKSTLGALSSLLSSSPTLDQMMAAFLQSLHVHQQNSISRERYHLSTGVLQRVSQDWQTISLAYNLHRMLEPGPSPQPPRRLEACGPPVTTRTSAAVNVRTRNATHREGTQHASPTLQPTRRWSWVAYKIPVCVAV